MDTVLYTYPMSMSSLSNPHPHPDKEKWNKNCSKFSNAHCLGRCFGCCLSSKLVIWSPWLHDTHFQVYHSWQQRGGYFKRQWQHTQTEAERLFLSCDKNVMLSNECWEKKRSVDSTLSKHLFATCIHGTTNLTLSTLTIRESHSPLTWDSGIFFVRTTTEIERTWLVLGEML